MKQLCTILLVACLASCREQHKPLDKGSVEAEVKEMFKAYCQDVQNHGLAAEFGYLDNSDAFYWLPPGYDAPLPYDSVAAILKRNAPALASVKNTYNRLQVVPLSKDIASYSGYVTSRVTDTAGHATVTQLVETGVVIRRNDGWKLLCGHTTLAAH